MAEAALLFAPSDSKEEVFHDTIHGRQKRFRWTVVVALLSLSLPLLSAVAVACFFSLCCR